MNVPASELDPVLARIESNPKYQLLKRRRNTLGWTLTVLMLAAYYGYVGLIAFDKEFRAQRLGSGVSTIGIPIATALSLHTGLPAAFVRKEAKKYGTALLAEGSEIAGRRVCVVEDVITTGGQVVISTADLRGLGAVVDHVLCVIDRSPDGGAALTAAGLQMHALLTRAQLDAAEARRG